MPCFHVLGLDLGQRADPSTLALVRTLGTFDRLVYDVPLLRRWPLGTSYLSIVADVRKLLTRPPLSVSERWPVLVVDGTGCGAAVVDLFRVGAEELGAVLQPVLITAGARDTPSDEHGYAHVAKANLVGKLLVAFQSRQLDVARDLALAGTLVSELRTFQTKITSAAHETFSAREGAHDDRVLAVALAVWAAELLLDSYLDEVARVGVRPQRAGSFFRVH